MSGPASPPGTRSRLQQKFFDNPVRYNGERVYVDRIEVTKEGPTIFAYRQRPLVPDEMIIGPPKEFETFRAQAEL